MTHNHEVKDMLLWSSNKAWYGYDSKKGFFLRAGAPQEAVDSFRKWASYQDSLGEEGYDYTFEVA